MPFKFEQLNVWKMSLDYTDSIYELAEKLPESERFNLKSQTIRAATSISLNIARGRQARVILNKDGFLAWRYVH
jgi:four helix bundle protein